MLKIIYDWDKSVTDAIATKGSQFVTNFENAIMAAGTQYQNLIQVNGDITLSLDVGYGEIGGVPIPNGDGAEGGPLAGEYLPYAQVVSELKTHTNSPSVLAQIATLPSTPPPNIPASLYIGNGELKEWGLMPANSIEPDGMIGFSDTLSYAFGNRAQPGMYDAEGMAMHEIGQAIFDRIYGGVLQLATYTAPGVFAKVNTPGYFSLDGGVTNLGEFSSIDTGDWQKGGDADPYNLVTPMGTAETNLTPTDLQVIDWSGFNTMQSTPPPKVVPPSSQPPANPPPKVQPPAPPPPDVVAITAKALGIAVNNPNIGEAYRLYRTELNRVPDQGGLTAWSNALIHGMTPLTAAKDFMASPEFLQKFGGLSISDFVTTLYQNALHRQPDAGGDAYWNNVLNSGASRASVVLGFSDSAECKMDTRIATHT